MGEGAGGDADDVARTRVEGSRPAAESAVIERGASVGRYVVTGELGVGGMGVVFAAYDPELDRKVALKLLSTRGEGSGGAGAARLLREAQALARLSHPNVVAIHDVGTIGAQVWLAMEYVDGVTMRTWLAERRPRWRQALEMMLAAGQGIAAAHAAGLVHRDLKPDNIMVGRDGRIRVMDFGLARTAGEPSAEHEETLRVVSRHDALEARVTEIGTVVGTPGYMAPEQWRGDEADGRADQFAFCVTLWEAIHGERPFAGKEHREVAQAVFLGQIREPPLEARTPRWLVRVLVRGMAVERARRYPSMEALLAALVRGQTAAGRRRVALVVGALAVAGLALALAWSGWRASEAARREGACEAAGAEIAALWGEDAAAALARQLTSTGETYAATSVQRMMPWLDQWARGWSAARTQVCREAEVLGVRDARSLRGAVICLEERREDLAALIGVIGEDPRAALPRAVSAAADLPAPADCLDAPAASSREGLAGRTVSVALRRDLAHVRALHSAGRYADGMSLVQALRGAAREEGDALLLAEASLAAARLAENRGEYEEARALGVDSFVEATAVGADDIALDAASFEVFVLAARLSQLAASRQWFHVSEALRRRLGAPEDLREVRRLNFVALLERGEGRHDEAKALHERALALHTRLLGPEHPELARTLNSLGTLAQTRGDLDAASSFTARALELSERALGGAHPQVASLLSNLGGIDYRRGDFEAAERRLTRSVELRTVILGPKALDTVNARSNLALVFAERRAFGRAIPELREVLSLREETLGPRHPLVADSLGNLARVLGWTNALEEAVALARRAVEIHGESSDPNNPDLAHSLLVLSGLEQRQGDFRQALAHAERSLAMSRAAQDANSPEIAGSLVSVGQILAELGEFGRARPMLEESLALGELYPDRLVDRAIVLDNLADLARREGDLGRAVELAERSLAVLRAAPATTFHAWPLIVLGEVALSRGQPLEARARFEQAVELTAGKDVAPDAFGTARFGLARALAALGEDPARAREAAEEALRFYRAVSPKRPELAEIEAWRARHARRARK